MSHRMRITVLLLCPIVWILSSCSTVKYFSTKYSEIPVRVKSFNPGGDRGSSPGLPELGHRLSDEAKPFILSYNRIAEVSSLLGAGKASWYGANFHGRSTASGERYDMHDLTAAHPNLPFNTLLWVENRDNGRSALVRINDRGPFSAERIIDLSREAADKLGMTGTGVARVNLYLASKDEQDSSSVKETDRIYTIQLGAFERGKKALSFACTIEESRVEIVKENGKTYYGVFYGRYAERSEAFRKQQKLQQQKKVMGLVKEREV